VLVLRHVHRLDLEGHVLLQKSGVAQPLQCPAASVGALLHGQGLGSSCSRRSGSGSWCSRQPGSASPAPATFACPALAKLMHTVPETVAPRLTIAHTWAHARALAKLMHTRGTVRPLAASHGALCLHARACVALLPQALQARTSLAPARPRPCRP
jgi:hypothetical protein